MIIALLIFIVILGILVFVHELGHFIAAKKNGIKVEEFGLGYPPRLWGKKVGETLYSINLIPLGGFVNVFGEEYKEEGRVVSSGEKDKQRAFIYKKPWQKAVVLVAGVTMNFILGVFIYYFLLGTNGFQSEPLPLIGNYKFTFGDEQKNVLISSVLDNSPASKSEIGLGDIIYRIKIENSKQYSNWTAINSADELIDIIQESGGKNIYLDIMNVRDNEEKQVKIVPEINEEYDKVMIGVSLMESVTLVYDGPIDKLFSGVFHSYNILAYNFSTLGKLFGMAFETKDIAPVSQSVAGPVGIFSLVNEIISSSGEKLFRNILNFTALLSLSLAFMNILPIPVLDGGKLVFVIYEWVTNKSINTEVEKKLNLVGLVFLLSLVILVTFNDIYRLIAN